MYHISNRRYTGSKYKLLDWIEALILENCEGNSFFDVFAGTAVVSDRMKTHYRHIILNDFLYSNEVIYKAFFGAEKYRREIIEFHRTKYQTMNGDALEENYVSKYFGGKYFSERDAKLIGAIREDIEMGRGALNEREYAILLTSLLYSMDKIANTVGHYDAYRKIPNIEDRFRFELVEAGDCGQQFEIYREDSNELAGRIHADVAFIDPPYNSRQYSRFYHVLENITKWEKPKLEGTALKPPAENMSDYCRNNAPEVFADLINKLDAKYIVVTYNNTYNSKSSSSRNKITLEEIQEILAARGQTQVFEKSHPCFNAGKTEFDDHKEYLFITKVGADNER